MAESPPETKRDEQFPLLMVAGAGDGVPRPRSFSALWSLSSRPSSTATKRSLLDRFPGNYYNRYKCFFENNSLECETVLSQKTLESQVKLNVLSHF